MVCSLVANQTPQADDYSDDRLRFCVVEIRTKRWDDPIEPADGTRILICRYRPRGLTKADETWTEWYADLGPSKALHAAAYGKT